MIFHLHVCSQALGDTMAVEVASNLIPPLVRGTRGPLG